MIEKDYIIATNRVKVTFAISLMRDVLAGDEWGISEKQKARIMRPMCDAESRLFAETKIVTIDNGED